MEQNIINQLSKFSTASLVSALKNREGVSETWVNPHDDYQINVNLTNVEQDTGPAIILVVAD